MNVQARIPHLPQVPMSIEATGLNPVFARDILIKTMFRKNVQTATEVEKALSCTAPIALELVELARLSGMIEVLGNTGEGRSSAMRYQLSDNGKSRALDALAQSEYFGALPIPLDHYKRQVALQSVANVGITQDALLGAMGHLILPEGLLDQLGPAVNSGKSILMYGPPGNGKSSIANGVRDALGDRIFVPKVLEYSGQVISVYDPIVHGNAQESAVDPNSLRRSGMQFDNRYVLCNRPSVITGGELTLSMLELNYNSNSKTYQAPLQLKAAGGVFIVDDLGRQVEPPQTLINRWIVPMEGGEDILSLQSGEKFLVPFDTLVIFSTNFHPAEIFDGAALRRIFYKVLIDRPSRDQMIQIYALVSKAMKMPLDEEVLIHLFSKLYPQADNAYSAYHAPFLITQMKSICDYEGRPHNMAVDLVERAWENLFVAEGQIDR
ncbi:MAG: ATPase [Rhodobacteraceae bacterium]|nr:ATPase [Paracoccaceae bacterium]